MSAYTTDTVVFTIYNCRARIENASTQQILRNGQVNWSVTNRSAVGGVSTLHSIQVRQDNIKNSLQVECSVAGVLFGQNVFGTSNMKLAIRRIVELLISNLEFERAPDLENLRIQLQRVDVSLNLRLSSAAEVRRYLKQIARQLFERPARVIKERRSVCYSPRNGTDFSVNFYDKGDQMKHGLSVSAVDEEIHKRLVAECENILRVEVRVHAAELEKMKLTDPLDWTMSDARRLFIKYSSRLRLLNVISGAHDQAKLAEIPKGLRRVYMLLMYRVPLSDFYGKKTIENYQTKFRKLGIDINVPHTEAEAVPLGNLLSDRSRFARAPTWLIDAGMAPRPVSKIDRQTQSATTTLHSANQNGRSSIVRSSKVRPTKSVATYRSGGAIGRTSNNLLL